MNGPREKAVQRLEQLGTISDSASFLIRTFLSPASRKTADIITEWMASLGMDICRAADGTVRGILNGDDTAAKPILLGSHYDTVINAGRFDGPLGIVSALATLEILQEDNISLPYPVHVLAFSDEEGVRFHTTYLGSRSIIGPLDDETLAIEDSAGISIRAAIAGETKTRNPGRIIYQPGECAGYLEIHIEQGRVLEEAGKAACVVSSIAGQSRLRVTITGRADHAGTTPMPLRHDALTGAAECILAAEARAKENPPLLATVGKMEVNPGASNSVPQSAVFTIDLRHPDNSSRTGFLVSLKKRCMEISEARGLNMDWHVIQENGATPCDEKLTELLAHSLKTVTGYNDQLASGAGHDGVIVSKICPIAMLFIRCRDGLSHHPDEYASPSDISTGIDVLTHFLKSYQP